MSFEDKHLVCADCGQEFVFSADDQAFHSEKGFTNEPKRCRDCRQKRKAQRRGGFDRQKEFFDAVCAECGTSTTVPFKPTGDRPVYCRDCFKSRRDGP